MKSYMKSQMNRHEDATAVTRLISAQTLSGVDPSSSTASVRKPLQARRDRHFLEPDDAAACTGVQAFGRQGTSSSRTLSALILPNIRVK